MATKRYITPEGYDKIFLTEGEPCLEDKLTQLERIQTLRERDAGLNNGGYSSVGSEYEKLTKLLVEACQAEVKFY